MDMVCTQNNFLEFFGSGSFSASEKQPCLGSCSGFGRLLGPVNLGVDHLIIDKLLFPWGYDLLRVEPQSVDRGFDGEPLSSFSSTSSSFSEPTFLH